MIVFLGLLHLSAARAALVGFSPDSQNVALGSPASVDLVVSGLGDDILTGFSLEISYDSSILGFQSFTVGPGPTELDPLGLFPVGFLSSGAEISAGIVAVSDLSPAPDLILPVLQPNSFVLGTLEFDTLAAGTSALTISFAQLAGEIGISGFPRDLQTELQSGSIDVEVSVIPVPAAVWLFGTALIGLIGFGRRRKTISRLQPG